jgi:hypothetical protein
MNQYSMEVKISDEIVTFSKLPISGEKISASHSMVVDGEGMMGTMDYSTDRINVEIDNKTIVKILGAN